MGSPRRRCLNRNEAADLDCGLMSGHRSRHAAAATVDPLPGRHLLRWRNRRLNTHAFLRAATRSPHWGWTTRSTP